MRLSSASSAERRDTSGVQRPRGSRLLALSIVSISCSRLSKATSLSGRVVCGERMAVMDCFIKSASEGPPKRALRASGLGGGRAVGAWGSEVSVDEAFSMLHFRSWFIPGSMVGSVERRNIQAVVRAA